MLHGPHPPLPTFTGTFSGQQNIRQANPLLLLLTAAVAACATPTGTFSGQPITPRDMAVLEQNGIKATPLLLLLTAV
jgi:hypothetical protein